MTAPLPLAKPDHPGLDAAVLASLKSCRIDGSWAPTVTKLATGQIPGSSLRCCGSGCRPCANDLKRATVQTLQRVHAPPEPEPEPSGLLRRGARKVAGRVRGGIKRRLGS